MANDANYLNRSSSCGLSRKLAHHIYQVGITFETDAGDLGHGNAPVFNAHTIRKSPIRLEEVGQIVTKALYRSAFPGAEPRRA
jgi:hypothetical protein